MKKKILYSVIAVSLIGFVLFSYMQLNGNPIDKHKAHESLEEFLEQTYPDMDYEIKRSTDYGWVEGTFHFNVVKKESGIETIYEFMVSAIEPYEVYRDAIHDSKVDKKASEKLNAEAEQYILATLQKKVPEIDGVSTDVEVYNNESSEWTPQLKTPKPIHVMLGIERGDLTKEQMLEQSKTIQQELNSESINYYMAEAGYHSVVDGEEDYLYVSFTPEQKLTIEDMD